MAVETWFFLAWRKEFPAHSACEKDLICHFLRLLADGLPSTTPASSTAKGLQSTAATAVVESRKALSKSQAQRGGTKTLGVSARTLKGEMPGPLPIWRGIMIQASTKSLIAEWLTGWLFA